VNQTREKRHRLPRSCYRGDVTVAITVCIADRYPIFTDPDVVAAFVSVLRDTCNQRHCIVPIYCFMPEHMHLILQGCALDADAWQAIIDFKQRTGYWLKQHATAICWQKDFYDHIVRREEDLGSQVRYIAANPVRRGLVSDWRDYPHTGAIGVDLHQVVSSTITL
jgi:putative transposase